MTAITHHAPDSLLAAYATGSLPHVYALVVASHISLCLECRAAYEAHEAGGGAVLETVAAETVSESLKSRTLSQLDAPFTPQPIYPRSGVFPGPVVEALKGRRPSWKSLGMGVRQCILFANRAGSVRLLSIPPGQAVPDHSHNGLELTLVLQGSFSDETGRFGVGDLEIADQDLAHSPMADPGLPCICLAATDAPLRFRSLIPRILQPLVRI
ncbi:ChrR family anti-sigma-E factor [Pontibaca salina]|uniref:Cupin domain-containing protein n=1 Tax=Pontibaca salina TaxID=2795731 RepID=A0A934HMU2_9RHOB|nr:ChrR family anti-sigma-E factor [Pontibaca salina]MBI6630978.1 cupin domain-containing protein [Pontibaca salina]